MFINNFSPVAIDLYYFSIKWYSLSYIFGILFGWIYIHKRILITELDKKLFSDYISYLIFGIIIGGRLGYVLIYNLNYYIKNPYEIFFIWEGGMSFHGGLIGVIICSIIFAKKNDKKSFFYLDLVSLSAPIGIFFGRIANFINMELYGRSTDLPWSVIFVKIDQIPRHPSQLYEAIFEGLILFIILNFILIKNLKNSGVISSYFLIIYSLFRFLIEFTRQPDLHIGLIAFGLSAGQILCFITFLFGIFLLFLKNEEK